MVRGMQSDITGDDSPVVETSGDERSFRSANIAAGRAVGELVRTTLGPRGMDKLLIDDTGMGIITNNGASILREMVNHPIGDLIADLAVSHEDEVSDGTTTTATLTGELLGEAEALIDRGVHPTTIAKGYLSAADRAVEVLRDNAVELDVNDTDRLVDVAATSMAGKATLTDETDVPALLVEAVQRVETEGDADPDDVIVETLTGTRIGESFLMDGVIVGQERADDSFTYRVEDATIAVVGKPIELRELALDANVGITTPADADRLRGNERAEATAVVDHLVDLGVNAVICGENIGELYRGIMAERGIYAARRVHDDELSNLVRATGATIVNDPRDIQSDDLGHADVVEESDIGGERKTRVEGCASATTATLILYGSTRDVVDELHRAVEDALSVLTLVLREPAVLPGGGAAETAVSLDLREYATQYDTREQLAVDAFADAVEVIPRTLAENAGINPIDGTLAVRSEQSTGGSTLGLDGETGEIVDTLDAGIVEPLTVKSLSMKTAAEAAVAVLRIDGALPKRDEFADETPEQGPAGGAGGMGGAGGAGGVGEF